MMKDINVLIIDDEINIIRSIEITLKSHQINSVSTAYPDEVFKLLHNHVDVVLLDVYLGAYKGREILERIILEYPLLPVIMISGLASVEEAVDCIRLGAFDFIEKPLKPERLVLSIQNAARYGRLRQRSVEEVLPVYASSEMKKILEKVKKIAATDSTVLITGESGVGKDIIARLIHNLSPRSENPYIKLNCGAIPEGLVESELFGHKKGSFTGAIKDYRGKIQAADEGTLFLDEIAELSLNMQVKLLRFIENREMQRIGDDETQKVNVRLIAATNREIEGMVAEKSFREDLYFRLNILPIHIPPLRERKDDIRPLAEYFIQSISANLGKALPVLSRDAEQYLKSLPFKGNIRELRNIIERVVSLSQSGNITREEITSLYSPASKDVKSSVFEDTMALSEAKKLLEAEYIKAQLAKHNYSIKDTARALDILPNNLSRRIKQLDIES
jgi:two-component system nitrogen regulation response regulator NtrX